MATRKIEGVFPIPVFISTYDKHEELKDDFMHMLEDGDVKENNRSAGTFHVVNNFFDKHSYPAFDEWKQWMNQELSEYWINVLGKYKTDLLITDYWFNMCEQGGAQHLHDHCNAAFSGTYYINLSDHVHSKFHVANPHIQMTSFEPLLLLEKAQDTVWNQDAVPIEHGEGDLVLFPSWLRHGYPQNNRAGRVSLSFNVLPKTITSGIYTFEINNVTSGVELE